MKLHLVYVTGLAMMLIEPAVAQRNPDVEQALSQSVGKIFIESCKKGDAVYMASRYTDNALVLPPGPAVIGRQAIEKSWEAAFKSGMTDCAFKFDQSERVGNVAYAGGEWFAAVPGANGTKQKVHGNWVDVYELQGDTWKLRMQSYNMIPEGVSAASNQ